MQRLKLIFLNIFCATAMVLVTSGMALAELNGSLKANTNIEGSVPFDLAQKIAISIAQKKGQIAMGPALPCVDDDGDIVAYMFPFIIGAQTFPTDTEISLLVGHGRDIAQKGIEAMSETEKQALITSIISEDNKPNDRNFDPKVFGQVEGVKKSMSNVRELDGEARKFGHLRMIGADLFGTVVVSARFDRFPVPLYMNYLPPYIYQQDIAVGKASQYLSSQTAKIERIYFLENQRSQYLEISSSDRKVLLNAYSLEVELEKKVLTRRGKKITPAPEMLSDISQEWERIRQAVQ